MEGRNEEARQRILAKADEKFRRFGVRRVTMDEIAREIRMSKKTLYRHFSGKRDLVRQLAQDGLGAHLRHAIEALRGPESPHEAFAAGFAALRRMVRDSAPVFMSDVRAEYPDVWEEIETLRLELTSVYAQRIADGARSGAIRPGIEPEIVAGIMQAVTQHYMVPETFRDAKITPSEAVNTWFTLLASGLFKNPPELHLDDEAEA